MRLVTKKSINHLFEITSWLQSKLYYPNSNYISLTLFAGPKVYALFISQDDSNEFKSHTLMVYHNTLYVFEMKYHYHNS